VGFFVRAKALEEKKFPEILLLILTFTSQENLL
jgi:hypothetical protein